MAKKTLLVAGASGLVGYAALRHFKALPGWDVIGLSRRRPPGLDDVEIVSVDLTDAAACASAMARLSNVTHIVYAALFEKPGLIAGWRETDQMQTNLAMLRNLFEPLERAATGLAHVTLLQGTKAYGSHITPPPVPARERWPRHAHENFYWLQEDYLKSRQQAAASSGPRPWQMTILRPQVIFGESLGSHMNMIPAIGVYAALLKAKGEPLYFPGGAPRVFQAVDADLLARACAWAAETPSANGEAFNINNGEAVEWATLWPAIADAFGMAPGPTRPLSLATEMPRREAEWAATVARHGLVSPSSLKAFVGESFHYADRNFNLGVTGQQPPTLVSTVKARHAGFQDCVDTDEMFSRLIARFQTLQWLPPR